MKPEQTNTSPNLQRGHMETVYTPIRNVSCDGDSTALGHPRVFLKIKNDKVICPYCSKIFILSSQDTTQTT